MGFIGKLDDYRGIQLFRGFKESPDAFQRCDVKSADRDIFSLSDLQNVF